MRDVDLTDNLPKEFLGIKHAEYIKKYSDNKEDYVSMKRVPIDSFPQT